jgi:hypothetical protein
VSELDLSLRIARCPEENQGKPSGLNVDASLLDEAEMLAIEL